ncbi:hypothetical protein [Halomarina litorea]|uniref:hypothetical protein n=1 Tax=Halomarina litorea TaxID=2961595 RepID=UPI0020C4E4C8|nr:hypothetical protein [Halomarina sp. BCD28]
MSRALHIGDVALDLAQGRPVQVMDVLDEDAAEWSEQNGYDLTENYANERLGTSPMDTVYDCVYVNNARSEPSKTYAFPESRLLRLEPEAATDDEWPVQERLFIHYFSQLLDAAAALDDSSAVDQLLTVAGNAWFPPDLVDAARELHEAEQFGRGDEE